VLLIYGSVWRLDNCSGKRYHFSVIVLIHLIALDGNGHLYGISENSHGFSFLMIETWIKLMRGRKNFAINCQKKVLLLFV
jgi:hypothetical protein